MTKQIYFEKLVKIIEQLRSEDGCPWDIEQTHQSLRPYLLEECYEVLEAIDSENDDDLVAELGDVLLQIVFHSQIASENKRFDIEDVCKSIVEKLIRRHPHVFGDKLCINKQQVITTLDNIKKQEKNEIGHQHRSYLDGIPNNIPSLVRSQKLQQEASKQGFDWPSVDGPLKKLKEECDELIEACQQDSIEKIEDEFGDIIFSIVNIARFLNLDAEQSLRVATNKFERRFRAVENKLAEQKIEIKQLDLQQLDALWNKIKIEEKGSYKESTKNSNNQ